MQAVPRASVAAVVAIRSCSHACAVATRARTAVVVLPQARPCQANPTRRHHHRRPKGTMRNRRNNGCCSRNSTCTAAAQTTRMAFRRHPLLCLPVDVGARSVDQQASTNISSAPTTRLANFLRIRRVMVCRAPMETIRREWAAPCCLHRNCSDPRRLSSPRSMHSSRDCTTRPSSKSARIRTAQWLRHNKHTKHLHRQ